MLIDIKAIRLNLYLIFKEKIHGSKDLKVKKILYDLSPTRSRKLHERDEWRRTKDDYLTEGFEVHLDDVLLKMLLIVFHLWRLIDQLIVEIDFEEVRLQSSDDLVSIGAYIELKFAYRPFVCYRV